jgi:hypothetical protein
MEHPFKHFKTITKHRHAVIKHCAKAGIFWQGCRHDLSKYSPTEFLPGAHYYIGTRSPNEGEREEKGFSLAWIHHKGRNKHHFEYWTDYNIKTKKIEPVEMPLRYVAEMFCDRVAASKIYNGDKYTDQFPLEYFLRAKGRRVIHPNTSDLLESLLTELAEHGEKQVFSHIKQMLKDEKSKK